MKYKSVLVIIIVFILFGLFIYKDYINYKESSSKNDRTKVEYIFNSMNEDKAKSIGENIFINVIKVISYDYFEVEKDVRDLDNIYNIDNNSYVRVLNYNVIKDLFNNKDYLYYSESLGYKNVDNLDYIKVFSKDIDTSYVGSIIKVIDYDEDTISYESNNYYCSDYKFIGILDSIPECNIIKNTTSSFKLRKYNNSIRVNDINDFIGIKKIY